MIVERVSPDLRRVVQQLWMPTKDAERPVMVSFGALPPRYVAAEEYAVVPNLRKPKLLVPLQEGRTAQAAFSKYLATSHLKTRLLGHGVSMAFGSPVGETIFRDRLRVGVDSSIPRTQWPEWLLNSHLTEVLQTPNLMPFVTVRRLMPNSKPTLRLFDSAGRPHGFAKVGWSDATRVVVHNEATVLGDLAAGRLSKLRVPQLKATGRWRDLEYLVTSQLPAGLRPWHAEPHTAPEILLDIARSGNPSRQSLFGSSFSRRLALDLDLASTSQPSASAHLLTWLRRLELCPELLDFGRWHGDWVPWNMGQTALGPIAWDWEYSDSDVPIGFDLLHWHFQQSLSVSRLEDAIRATRIASVRLTALGVAPTSIELLVGLFLLETFTRATRMAAAGAGWNAKIFPSMMRCPLMPDAQ